MYKNVAQSGPTPFGGGKTELPQSSVGSSSPCQVRTHSPPPSDSSVVISTTLHPLCLWLSLSHTCAHLIKKVGSRHSMLESLKKISLSLTVGHFSLNGIRLEFPPILPDGRESHSPRHSETTPSFCQHLPSPSCPPCPKRTQMMG